MALLVVALELAVLEPVDMDMNTAEMEVQTEATVERATGAEELMAKELLQENSENLPEHFMRVVAAVDLLLITTNQEKVEQVAAYPAVQHIMRLQIPVVAEEDICILAAPAELRAVLALLSSVTHVKFRKFLLQNCTEMRRIA